MRNVRERYGPERREQSRTLEGGEDVKIRLGRRRALWVKVLWLENKVDPNYTAAVL